ncbi:dynein heavy chain domain-containing protein 1-like isoform X2 [Dendronephthya gigantea]|uniref:dynein heavy chain domain-containing protein 1-like isoform X2 n=1 Tax=Dendronephthya gigantea TaxID=151771 RepID=UPI00106C3182|nr:dynein heavy chain domain-containing protein 1-like isoform X2 [Dendronephthya gigantea]
MSEQARLDSQSAEVSAGDTSDVFLDDLIQKVVHGFVSSLQNDLPDMWQSFNEVLQIIQPYSSLIEENAQLMHYVERSYQHVCEKPECGLDLDALSLAFPQQVSKIQANSTLATNKKVKFPAVTTDVESEASLPDKKVQDRKGINVPKGAVIPPPDEVYDNNVANIKQFFPTTELNISDLRTSLPFVVYEIGLREASWGQPLGITATALNTDLAEMLPGVISPRTSGQHLSEDQSSTSNKSVQDKQDTREEKATKRLLTGREVVERFVKGHFLGSTKFAYLNRAESKHYDPYNLIVVQRKKIKPEHFVVSSHAILHVIPNRPSELVPLSQWYKEALLFNAILKFSFFKNFLIAKMFLRWRCVKKLSQFRSLCDHISKSMITCTPGFGSALLRIYSLVVDLDQVQLLPLNDQRCKPLQEFNTTTIKLLDDAQECLNMFYTYCLSVINKTKDNCFEYLEHCKEQLEKKPKNKRGQSISVAKEQKAIKLQNLKLARQEIFQLERFIQLVEQILITKLLSLARQNVCTFVTDVLDNGVIKDQGLFYVSLKFDKADKLVLNPDHVMLQGSLYFALESVLRILCQTSDALQAGFMNEHDQNVEREDSPATTSSERSDSRPTQSQSPNMLQNFLIGQSPVMPTTITSLPRLSIYDRTAHNTPVDRVRCTSESTQLQDGRHEKTTNLKSLLEESLVEEARLSPEMIEEERPDSAERCVEPTRRLLVEGKSMPLQLRTLTSPLSKKKLEGVVFQDADIVQAIRREEEIVNDAIAEVTNFCSRHEWVVDVHRFVRTWNNTVLASWRGRPTETIEKQLSQIKTWIEDMRKFTLSFCTTNGLLFVDCSGIRDRIIPKLDAIFRQFTKMVAKDLLQLCKDFNNELASLIQQLSYKSNDLRAFADFMALQKTTKEKVPALHVKVDYIKSLFEMIRSSQRQLTREEEEAEEKTWSSWENFLLCLQESSDYLIVKMPQILGDVEETIMSLEHQARVIGEKATRGEYLIPENNPTLILTQLRELRQRFMSLLNKCDELIECREVICGRKYNKSVLLELLKKLDVRYELWKYYDVSGHTIRDWLQISFRKMNIKRVMEKVSEWQQAAVNIKTSLPHDDEVYKSWVYQMESFMKDFPLLQLLFNDALKPRHWKALFVGMGQQYDPTWQFTIADLYSFKLGLHKELINSICNGAVKEYALELNLRSVAKKWTEKDFKLAKHFCRTRSPVRSETTSSTGRNSSRKGMKSRQKQTRLVDMYILAGDDELKCLIEDNRVTLQLMLISPYVADLKPTVEGWMKNLEQLEEILGLWVACQKKWLYLSMVFNEDAGAYDKVVLVRFDEVDRRFKEFMYSVSQDSKVLSVLAKKRGQKGYRELQGETLRSMLFSLLKEEEELLKALSHKMESVREDFPRLYFLSDDDVLDVLVTSNDPRKLLPVVRKCFPGIRSVKFSFPDEGIKANTALDAALKPHLLQATVIEGEYGELMTLTEAIPAGMISQAWLKVLEKSMKATLMMNFTKCLVNTLSRRKDKTVISEFLEKGLGRPERVENEVEGERVKAVANDKDEEIPFLLRYPSQCVRCVEAVIWSKNVSSALACDDKNALKTLSLLTSRQVEDYGHVLSVKNSESLETVPRLRPVLQSLLVRAVHQRDVIERLVACNAACSHCFEWQSCLQHEVPLNEVYHTTYYSGLTGSSHVESTQDTIPLDMKYEFGGYDLVLLGSKFPYGFEYMSERASLILSPLTERCFMTLSLALQQYSCGTLIGFNGSGKTETIKELGKLMGRHLVFYNCSRSMATSVITRMLTGMILSGSWVCFKDPHKLSQLMLSILGDYLGCVRQAYHCLMANKNNQYQVRGQSDDLRKEEKAKCNKQRRNSVATLDPLTLQVTRSKTSHDGSHENSVKKFASISRRFSICESRNLDKRRYYGDTQPLPVMIPVTDIDTNFERDLSKEEDMILMKDQDDLSLGHIVFNGALLKTHSMAGCFMAVTPDKDGYLNIPDNLKASMRTVSMLTPNANKLLEVLLLCHGFSDVQNLAEKILFFIHVINELPSEQQIGPSILKAAIVMAGNKLQRDHNLTDNSRNKDMEEREETADQPGQDEMRSIASSVSLLEEFENRTREESAIVYGLFSVLCPKLDEERENFVCGKIDAIFTHTVLRSATQTDAECVAEAVREQLSAESLHPSMDLVSKVIQLYQVLQINHAVIILGLSGTGKTTIYKTLCKAINSLNTQSASRVSEKGKHAETEQPKYPKINLTVLFPRSMSESELFGRIDPVTNFWSDGIVVKCARNALAVKNASEMLSSKATHSAARSDYHQWIVLDGPLDHGCVDQMNLLLDDSRSLSLASGEVVPLSESMNFLLEVDDLQNAAPTIVSRCGIVYCPDNTVGWKSVFKSWMKEAHATWNITIRGLGIISSLMDHCVEKTLTFLSGNCTRILYANFSDNQMCLSSARGMHEIQRMLVILSSLFDKYILRDNDETLDILDHLKSQQDSRSSSSSETCSERSSSVPAHDANTVISSFAYAYIWAFGGDLHESCIEAFDEFTKALLSSGPYPHNGLPPVTVFDYHLDFPNGTLLSSTEKLSGKPRVIASSYVVMPRDEVYLSLLDILLSAKKSVLLVGRPGCGKSSFMQNLVNSRFKYLRLSLAHGTSTQFLQETIESKVKSTTRRPSVVNNLALSSQNTRNVFFFDDMNMAATDGTSNQPSSELIRSLISLGGLYHRQRLCLKPLANTCLVGAAVPPGYPGVGGSVSTFAISPRLTRIMIAFSFHALSTATLQSIYCNLFQTWLEDFPAYSLTHHHQLAKAISTSTISLFEKVSEDLRPSPLHPHYIFTQHDVSRVYQGMMLLSSRTKTRPRVRAKKQTPIIDAKEKASKEIADLHDSSFRGLEKKSEQNGNKLHEVESWPMVRTNSTLVSINAETPALTTPLIRVILRLWCHECTRVFSDRLIGEDQLWFSTTLRIVALQHFCEGSEDSPEEGTDIVVFQRVTPRTPEASPAIPSSSSHSGGDHDKEPVDDTIPHVTDEATQENVTPTPVDGESSDISHAPVLPTSEDLRDCKSAESVLDVSQTNERKTESESAVTDESSSDESDLIPQEPKPRTALSKQRVVTFEDMSRQHSYRGPLITSDQLIEADEDLTKIIFCRHFTSSVKPGAAEQERGYGEVSVAMLTEGLKHAQELYNQQDVLPLDLVFFENAVRHAARLSRTLCLSSGNALLMSKSGHGRKDLVLLSSFAAGCKLVQLRENDHEDSRQRMKSAVFVAGLQGKQVLVYIPQNIDRDTLQDVCSLMSEGNCPGLYSTNELATVCNELIPGSLRGRRNDSVYVAQERFFRRVRTNLHVIVGLEFPSDEPCIVYNSSFSTFSAFPLLLTRTCSVDVFQPWHSASLTKVSTLRLASKALEPAVREMVKACESSLAATMSYVYTSAVEMLEQQFGFNKYKCYTPKTFVEFNDIFVKCCNLIWKEEQDKIARCEKALAKIEETNRQISEMQKDLDSFIPILRTAEQDVKDCLQMVEGLQADYAEGREKCKQQEIEIEKMTAPIAELERLAKIELDRVSPVFRSAYDALRALNVYDVEEIRSYRTPPELVVLVVNAVCLLFGKEETWEEGKVLFTREDFIKDLEFFNMKAISDKTFLRLKEYVQDPLFVPETVKEGSHAAMSICVWIRAVYRFCVVYREYFPKQQRVIEAKKILDEAVAYLGDLRVRCNEIKGEVESKIQEYKDKVHHARSIEKQIQITEQKKLRAELLIRSMSSHVNSWQEKLDVCQYHIKTLIADALLTAACICYLGPMDEGSREHLLREWKTICEGRVEEDDDDNDSEGDDVMSFASHSKSHVDIRCKSTSPTLPAGIQPLSRRSNFNLKDILSSKEELYSWRYSGLPVTSRAVDNALIMRAVCDMASRHWPLLVDTDMQSYAWVKCFDENKVPEGGNISTVTETNDEVEESDVLEDAQLLSPVSPGFTTPGQSNRDSDEEFSTNYDESDSTVLTSSQSNRRASAGACSGLLIREDLARELNIMTSTPDDTSLECASIDFEFDADEIMIISAVDRHRDIKICRAVSIGATVLLIDIERQKLGTSLHNLLARNTFTEKHGKQKIQIGGRCVDYHPAFRLYLYTNIPLELTTEETISSLFTKCLVINMALCSEGLQEHLLAEVLSLERPEYDTESRALEANIYHHEEQIKMAKDAVLERVINMKERLLESNEISQALKQCDEACKTARQQLEETKALLEISKEKQEDYAHVSEHGAAILLIVSRLSRLHSYYQTPFHVSLRFIHEVVNQRKRGKRSSGSSLARSAELITYVTRAMCSKIAKSVFFRSLRCIHLHDCWRKDAPCRSSI